jgi:hypothetical protein
VCGVKGLIQGPSILILLLVLTGARGDIVLQCHVLCRLEKFEVKATSGEGNPCASHDYLHVGSYMYVHVKTIDCSGYAV